MDGNGNINFSTKSTIKELVLKLIGKMIELKSAELNINLKLDEEYYLNFNALISSLTKEEYENTEESI